MQNYLALYNAERWEVSLSAMDNKTTQWVCVNPQDQEGQGYNRGLKRKQLYLSHLHFFQSVRKTQHVCLHAGTDKAMKWENILINSSKNFGDTQQKHHTYKVIYIKLRN